MPDLKLIKNPGYVYDLMFLFYYKFNADLIPETFEATEDDMEYFSKNVKIFDPISDDLYIFFRLVPSKRCFFTVNYFNNFAKVFTTEYRHRKNNILFSNYHKCFPVYKKNVDNRF